MDSPPKNVRKKMSNYRMNESKYIDAYKTMIYSEEAAQSNFLGQFNRANVQLKFSQNDGQFYMRNDVIR